MTGVDHLIIPVFRSIACPITSRLFFVTPAGNVSRNNVSPQMAMPPCPSFGSGWCHTMFWFAATLHDVGAFATFTRQVPLGPLAWGQLSTVPASPVPEELLPPSPLLLPEAPPLLPEPLAEGPPEELLPAGPPELLPDVPLAPPPGPLLEALASDCPPVADPDGEPGAVLQLVATKSVAASDTCSGNRW